MILFEKQGQRRVPFFGFIIYFSLKKSTGNSQGLMHFSNNSALWSMYKERKRIMSTIASRFSRENFLAWKNQNILLCKGKFVTFLVLVGLGFS